jgi:hypothetical protein
VSELQLVLVMKINSELTNLFLSELTTDPSFWKDAKPVQLWNSKKRKINVFVYRNAFDPSSQTKHPCPIWNRLKKIKQALFLED